MKPTVQIIPSISILSLLMLCSNSVLTAQPQQKVQNEFIQLAIVDTKILNVRAAPNIDAEIVGKLDKNQKIQIGNILNFWVSINFKGTKRWVYKSLVTITEEKKAIEVTREPEIHQYIDLSLTKPNTLNHVFELYSLKSEVRKFLGEPSQIRRAYNQANKKDVWLYNYRSNHMLYMTFLNDHLISHHISLIE